MNFEGDHSIEEDQHEVAGAEEVHCVQIEAGHSGTDCVGVGAVHTEEVVGMFAAHS